MIIPSDEQQNAVEQILDASSLSGMVECLIQICHAKAEHLRKNWQDERAARFWEKEAATLEKVRVKLNG